MAPKGNKRKSSEVKKEPMEMTPKPKRRRSNVKEVAYEVSNIVRHVVEDNELLFEVNWKGYTDSTWEPVTSLQPGATEILLQYARQATGKHGSMEDLLDLLEKAVEPQMADDIRISATFLGPHFDAKLARFKKYKSMGRVLQGFCRTVGLSIDNYIFFFNGKQIMDTDTSSSLGMHDGDTIDVRAPDKPPLKVDGTTFVDQPRSLSQHAVPLDGPTFVDQPRTSSQHAVPLDVPADASGQHSPLASIIVPGSVDRVVRSARRRLLSNDSENKMSLCEGSHQLNNDGASVHLSQDEGSVQELRQPGTPIVPARLFGSTSTNEVPKEIKRIIKFMKIGTHVLVLCECVDGTFNQFTYRQMKDCWPTEFDDFMKKFILDRIKGSAVEA